MSFDTKFNPIRTNFYLMVSFFFKIIVVILGYPLNSGMPFECPVPTKRDPKDQLLDHLLLHETVWPPTTEPQTLFEAIFGIVPKIDIITRYMYKTKKEGFYNFYIENFKNIVFLADWFSEFLQIQLNFCLDITFLEEMREGLFTSMFLFSQLLSFRITLAWFLSVNPYKTRWIYLLMLVDWAEELLQGCIPVILGVNLSASMFLGTLGYVCDSLNHLVFTMPFLPSEGKQMVAGFDEDITADFLVFHYLPILWVRYPIPNSIREFWLFDRADIFNYMKKTYTNIRIFPDNINY